MRIESRGQTLVLGALLMLMVVLAVLLTVSIGHRATERERLQNTADAAAASLATASARAFNLHAYANRAQVSHYASAMIWQSTLSFLYFTEAFIVDAYGVMRTLSPCARPRGAWQIVCPLLSRVPGLGQLLTVSKVVLQVLRGFLREVLLPTLRRTDPDHWIGAQLIPAHRALNQALAEASRAAFLATLRDGRTTAARIVAANDPELTLESIDSEALAVSACLFKRSHMPEGGVHEPPVAAALDVRALAEGSKVARAKRVMGQLANATRFACDGESGGDCAAAWSTDRRLSTALPGPAWLPLAPHLGAVGLRKWGQARLLSWGAPHGRDSRAGGNLIRDWRNAPDAPLGALAQGDVLGADDLYAFEMGPGQLGPLRNPLSCSAYDDPRQCWGDPRFGKGDHTRRGLPFRHMLKTGVWALSDQDVPGGIHWRLAYVAPNWPVGHGWAPPTPSVGNDEAELGLSRFSRCLLARGCGAGGPSVDVWVANVLPIRDGNHRWEGLVPFPHFEPGAYSAPCGVDRPADPTRAATREEDFNQPSSWIVLRKDDGQLLNQRRSAAGSHRPAQLGGTVGLGLGSTSERLDLAKDDSTGAMVVVSRAQTYYHRPGTWSEQPSFFNPYWRARLAPVWQGRRSYPKIVEWVSALPPPLAGRPDHVLTH